MSHSTRTAWVLFAAAWGTNHFVPLLLVYRAHLALSPVLLAILFGVYAVGLVPGLIVGGPLSDRAGRRAVVVRASALAFLGSVILSFGSTGFPVLLVGRFVVGLGSGATFSAGTAWIQDLSQNFPAGTGARRASVALSSGFGLGPLAAGLLAQWAPWPMVTPYILQGILLFAAVLSLQVMTREPQSARPARALAGARPTLPPGFLAAIGPTAPWMFGFPSIAFAVLPQLVSAQLGHWAVAYSGIVTAATLLSGVLVQPTLKAWSPQRAATLALLVGTVGICAGLLSANRGWPWGVLAAAPLMGVGYGGCFISGLRIVESTTTSRDRGYVTGTFYAFAYIGFAVPLALAEVAQVVGYWPGILGAAVLAIVTAVRAQYTFPAIARHSERPVQ